MGAKSRVQAARASADDVVSGSVLPVINTLISAAL